MEELENPSLLQRSSAARETSSENHIIQVPCFSGSWQAGPSIPVRRTSAATKQPQHLGKEKFLCISETGNADNQLRPEPLANMRKILIHSQKAGENSVGFGDLTTLPCVKINIKVSHQIQTQPNRFTYWGLGLLLWSEQCLNRCRLQHTTQQGWRIKSFWEPLLRSEEKGQEKLEERRMRKGRPRNGSVDSGWKKSVENLAVFQWWWLPHQNMPFTNDPLHPSPEEEKRTHKKKRLVWSPSCHPMGVKCPGYLNHL